jgi:signal transduction histidine kinase
MKESLSPPPQWHELLRRSNETRRILSDASAILATSLDYETTLATVANLAVPELGEWCAVELIEDGTLRRLALAHSDPEMIRRAQEFREKYPVHLDAPYGTPLVIRNGRALMVEHITEEMFRSAPLPAEELEFIRALKIRSYIGVPLRARGHVLGAISFVTSVRDYDRQDLEVAEELASRIAISIDNSRLYQAATSGERHMRFFAELSLALAKSLSYSETVNVIVRLAVATLCDYAIIYRLEGGSINRAAAAHRDVDAGEWMSELLAQPVSPKLENEVLKVIQTGEPMVVSDIQISRVDESRGNAKYVSLIQRLNPTACVIVPLAARGRALGALCLAMTDSGRKFNPSDIAIVEELGRRAALSLDNAILYEDAVEASRVKDQFLAILSHELRTPLTSVHGWLTLMRSGSVPPGKEKDALDTMDRNIRAQITLIDELLDLSRIANGTMQLDVSEVDVVESIQAALALIQPAVRAKNIHLEFNNELPSTILRADAVRLQQMLWNLLSNAAKFTPSGGAIIVTAKTDGEVITFVISDNGPGIQRSFLPFVFDRFRQGDSSTTRNHGGLGIGLSVVKHLAELHGGSVLAASDGPGKGASFTLRLPVHRS